jgi:ArsR family metal-binding transcriptional regulator
VEIEKDKKYEIIVFPNQEEGLKAQGILLSKGEDFKYISTLAVAVPEDRRQQACRSIIDGNALISGYYPFLYRDYEEDFFKRAEAYRTDSSNSAFLKTITLCYVAPCMADEKKIRLIAYFNRDITDILPYLNAVIKSASYNKGASTLTFAKEHRLINLYNIKTTIAKANDIIDAWHILDEIKVLINKTHENRVNIKPNYEEKVKVTALQIYGWLPKTNCKACGEATCLAFAIKLLQGEQKLSKCVPLSTEQKFTENKNIMQELTEALGVS